MSEVKAPAIGEVTPIDPIPPVEDITLEQNDEVLLEEYLNDFHKDLENFKLFMEGNLKMKQVAGSYGETIRKFSKKLAEFAINVQSLDSLSTQRKVEIVESLKLDDIEGLGIIDLIEMFQTLRDSMFTMVKTDYGMAPVTIKGMVRALDKIQKSMREIVAEAIKISPDKKLNAESLRKVLSGEEYRVASAFGIQNIVINDLMAIYKESAPKEVYREQEIPVVRQEAIDLRNAFEEFKMYPSFGIKGLAGEIKIALGKILKNENGYSMEDINAILNTINLAELNGFGIDTLIDLLQEIGGEVEISKTKVKNEDRVESVYISDVVDSLESLKSMQGTVILEALSESVSNHLDAKEVYSALLSKGFKIPMVLGINNIVVNEILARYNGRV